MVVGVVVGGWGGRGVGSCERSLLVVLWVLIPAGTTAFFPADEKSAVGGQAGCLDGKAEFQKLQGRDVDD